MKRFYTCILLLAALMVGTTAVMAQKSVLDENFADGSLPSGWTTAGSFWKFDDNNAKFTALSENGVDTLFTPVINLSELDNQPSVKIAYSNAANGANINALRILYRATEQDAWEVLAAFENATEGEDSWKGALPSGLSNVQIALAGAYLGGAETRVYRLSVENKTEAATAPTGLLIEGLTTNSVTLWWDVCSSPKFVQYNLKVNSAKMTDMSAEADVLDRVGWLLTDEFYELSGLDANKTYWVYVQYDCGDGDVSPWAELNFTTPCAAISIPFVEDFEDELSNCFTIINNSAAAAVSSEYPHNSTKSFKFSSSKEKYNYLILPELSSTVNQNQVSFWASAMESGDAYARTITVGVCTDITEESFTEVATLNLPKGRQWENIIVSLAGYAGAGKYIAFRAGNADKENRIFIDDIRVEKAASCPKPMFVTVSEITPNSAKLSWTKSGAENEWNLVLSIRPLSDPEDIEPDATKGEFAGAISTNPDTLKNLKPNTTYYAYLQAGCGSSEWTSATVFTTAKEISYPYYEAFDRMPADMYTDKAGAFPESWVEDSRWNNIRATNYDNYSSTYRPYVSTKQNHANSAYVNASLRLCGTGISSPTATTGGYTSIAMLPAIPKDVKNVQISFWAYSKYAQGDIKIGVANTQTADLPKGQQLGANITEVGTVAISKAETWVKYAVSLASYEGSGRYITLYLLPGVSTPEVFIDDIVVEDITCGEITEISAEAVNTTSARASWNDISATSWKVKVSSSEIDPITENGDIANETVTEKTYVANGLTPNTTYFFYISPACVDKWEKVEATTLNVTGTAIPYYNDFTDETSGYGTSTAPVRGPKDWKLGYTYADTYSYSTSSVPYVYATTWTNPPYGVEKNSLYLYNTATASTQFPYAIMPEVTNAAIKDLTISFYAYTTLTTNLGTATDPNYSQFKIGVVESVNDINKANGFTNVIEVATVKIKASKVAQLCVVDMSSYTGAGKCIVFYNDKVNGTAKACTNYIDNLSITLSSANAPLAISDLAVSDISQTSAKLKWIENGNATQWEARLFKSVADDPAEETPVWSSIVSEDSVVATGLSNSTKYYAYVRSIQANGNGAWGGPVDFYTECGPMAVPFFEDFNSYATGGSTSNTFSPCYYVEHSSASTWPYVRLYTGATQYHESQSNLLYMTAGTNKVCQLEFPQLSAPVNTLQMELEASGYSTYVGAKYITFFGVVTSDGTFHEVAQRTNSAQKLWEPWVIDFSGYTGENGVIAIRLDPTMAAAASGTAATTQYVFIENVKISVIPECRKLQGADMSAQDVMESSATITWPAGGAEQWNVKVSSSPLENPDTDVADVFSGVVNTTPSKALSDLMDNTKHYVYVQVVRPEANCVGEWSTPFTFKTLCFPRQFPYEEDFDSYETTGAGNLPDCANICGEDKEHSYITTKSGVTGKLLYLRQVTKAHNNYFVFPALNSEDVRKLQLSMQVYTSGTTATNTYKYEVGIMTNPLDPSTFVSLYSEGLAGSSTAYDRVYKFDAYLGDEQGNYGGYVALHPIDYSSSTNTNAGASTLYIDNVVIDLISTCDAPNDLKTDSIGRNGATFVWNSDDKTATHRVRIFTNADAKPNSNTFVAEAVVNDTIAELTGLNANTTYYAFVRKECAADNLSKWSSALKFKTECAEVQPLPYIEGFEGTEPPASITAKKMPDCWENLTIQGCGDYPSYFVSSAKKDGEYGLYLNTTEVDEHAGGSCVGRQRSAVVTPALDVANLNELLVYFDTKAVSISDPGSIKIEAVADETLDADAIYITTVDGITNTSWKKGYVRVGDYYHSVQPYKRLRFTPTGSTSVYIDNMVFTKDLNVVFPVDNLKALMVTENSIKFSFEETTPVINQWQVAYVAEGGDIADAAILTIDTTVYTLAGLNVNTSYDIYVRGNVDGDPWVGPLTAATLQTPATLPYKTGFELTGEDADGAMWNLYNVRTVQGKFYPNFFIIGDADKCEASGSNALFVTNDSINWKSWGARTPAPDDDIASSSVWATRNISIPSAGTYKFSYKIKSPVAYSSHGAWAQLIPAGATIKGETATLLNGTTRSGKATSSAPANNCYTVMSQQFSVQDWTWYTQSVDVEEPGVYTLGIFWYNSAAGAKNEKPVAVDSVIIEEYLCTTPKNIELTNLSAETVSLKWFAGQCTNFEYVVSQYKNLGNPGGIDAEDKVAYGTITDGPQVTIGNLLPSEEYHFYVRTLCPDGETDWVEFEFTTPCEKEAVPYTETFVEEPECWVLNGATVGTIQIGTGSDDYEVWNRLTLAATSGMAILPEFDIDLRKIEIELGIFNTSSSYGAVSLGVMDNTWDVSTFQEVAFFQTAIKTPNAGSTYTLATLEVFSKMLNLYQGTGKVLAIKNATANTIGIKYVKVTELPDCIKPQQIELTYPTETEITVNWFAGVEDAWEIKLNDSIIENVTTNPYRITGLEQGTTYTISVRAICDATHTSEWSESAIFVTKCGVNSLPMNEDFSNLPRTIGTTDVKRAVLTCWDNMVSEVKIDQVFRGEGAPLIPPSNDYAANLWVPQWLSRLGDYKQLESYRYSSKKYKYKWFISPQYRIEGSATLSFDIRSCGNAGQAVPSSVDRTFVAISTDNGATWLKENATEVKDIDSAYTTKSISLEKYAGQNIRVAFYDENTISYKISEQPFILIDNVRMNCSDTFPVADNACQGVDYEGNGFAIAKEDLPIEGQDSTYYRFAKNDGTGCDSIVALTITTHTASPVVTVYDTICEGQSYTYGGQTLTESNLPGQPYHLYGQTVAGCDSIIDLYLNVQKKDTITQEPLTVPQTILPYQVDQYYTIPAGTALGQFEQIVPQGDGCIAYRYIITIVDRGTGIIDITDGVDRVEVYDALGRKVQTLTNQSGVVQLDLPVGMYMIRTTMLSGDTMSNKIVIK